MKKPLISVIIPVKEINDYLRTETVPALLKQTFKDFEIIILPDKKSNETFAKTKIYPSWPKTGPADKRDIGARLAKGEFLAFLDDDSYPESHWLENALNIFEKESDKKLIAVVCGPSLTPANDNILRKASGYVWSSWLGSGGAGTYRCDIERQREVDDFPSVNFIVKKKDFEKLGGFDSKFWPGEDTKLCHDIVYKLGKKIIYSPKILVYHHRREIFGKHLMQISRYAIHRGHFARILPQTSFRLGYFMPTFFVIGLVSGFFLSFVNPIFKLIYLSVLVVYVLALFQASYRVFIKEKSIVISLLVIPAIFVTHLYYGILFIRGYFTPKLKSVYKQ